MVPGPTTKVALEDERFQAAMKKELEKHHKMKMFTLVPHVPPGKRLFSSLWVTMKVDNATKVKECKSWLVVDGRPMIKGKDFDHLYMSTPSQLGLNSLLQWQHSAI